MPAFCEIRVGVSIFLKGSSPILENVALRLSCWELVPASFRGRDLSSRGGTGAQPGPDSRRSAALSPTSTGSSARVGPPDDEQALAGNPLGGRSTPKQIGRCVASWF